MLIEILLLLVLILANGALALSEIAVVSSRRTRLAQLSDAGSAGAARALELAAEPTRFLSTVQVGITTIGILSGAIGQTTIARRLAPSIDALAPDLAAWSEAIALGLVVLAITYVSLILGELVPKRLALADPERVAAVVARPMQLVARLGRPVVHVLSASTDAVLRLLLVRNVKPAAATIEEIKLLLEQSTSEGVLEPGEQAMMTNVLNLDERHVAGVLTPRSDIVYLDLQDSPEANRQTLRDDPHDTLPLCDGGLDHVVGFVRVRRVLEAVLGDGTVDLRALADPPLFVPETMTLMRLLEEFKRSGLTAALAVDEFGGIEGIATLTDVVSAIVGELPAEPGGEPAIVRRDDGSWLLDGALDLSTLVQTLDDQTIVQEADRFHYHTLGGLAMSALGRVPRTGDVFERGRYRFEVVDMDGNRVDRVLASRRST
jgi:putative hemolysin